MDFLERFSILLLASPGRAGAESALSFVVRPHRPGYVPTLRETVPRRIERSGARRARSRTGKETASSDGGADTLIFEAGVQCILHALSTGAAVLTHGCSASDSIREGRRFQTGCHIGKFRLWALQTQESIAGKFEDDGEPIIAAR